MNTSETLGRAQKTAPVDITKTLAAWLRENSSGNYRQCAEAADRLEELERELAESRQWSSKLADVADDMRADLAAERALADRLAGVMFGCPSRDQNDAYDAWKEARRA